ncbi:hypothetical protein K438DRAFT_1969391 [Mycena galopus ATCC 62051]|nr:hypothetical protein K438DRAFT_1969391 [Mycena galopus ATCC 62051]
MSTTQTYTINSPLAKPASGSGSITLSPSLAPSLSTSSSMASLSIPTSSSTSATSTSTSAPCGRFDAECRKNTQDEADEQQVVLKVVLSSVDGLCDVGAEFVRVLGRRRGGAFCAAWMRWIRIPGRLEGCSTLATPTDFSTPNPPHCDFVTLSSHRRQAILPIPSSSSSLTFDHRSTHLTLPDSLPPQFPAHLTPGAE